MLESLRGGLGEGAVVEVWGFLLVISKDIRGLGKEYSSLLAGSLIGVMRQWERKVREG